MFAKMEELLGKIQTQVNRPLAEMIAEDATTCACRGCERETVVASIDGQIHVLGSGDTYTRCSECRRIQIIDKHTNSSFYRTKIIVDGVTYALCNECLAHFAGRLSECALNKVLDCRESFSNGSKDQEKSKKSDVL